MIQRKGNGSSGSRLFRCTYMFLPRLGKHGVTELFARANGAGSCFFGKPRKAERGNGYGRCNIEGFYVAAERDGKSSGGLLAGQS